MDLESFCKALDEYYHENTKYKLDELEPGIYALFTDDQDTETVCINIRDIVSVEEGQNDFGDDDMVIWVSGEPKNIQYTPLGGVWLIEIK